MAGPCGRHRVARRSARRATASPTSNCRWVDGSNESAPSFTSMRNRTIEERSRACKYAFSSMSCSATASPSSSRLIGSGGGIDGSWPPGSTTHPATFMPRLRPASGGQARTTRRATGQMIAHCRRDGCHIGEIFIGIRDQGIRDRGSGMGIRDAGTRAVVRLLPTRLCRARLCERGAWPWPSRLLSTVRRRRWMSSRRCRSCGPCARRSVSPEPSLAAASRHAAPAPSTWTDARCVRAHCRSRRPTGRA